MDPGDAVSIHYLVYLLNKHLLITYFVPCLEPGIGHTMKIMYPLVHGAEGLMRVYSPACG